MYFGRYKSECGGAKLSDELESGKEDALSTEDWDVESRVSEELSVMSGLPRLPLSEFPTEQAQAKHKTKQNSKNNADFFIEKPPLRE